MKTSAYIQVSGFIHNDALGLKSSDGGGELDPHGCDLQGNPLGGVVFSNGTTKLTWNLKRCHIKHYTPSEFTLQLPSCR